MVADNQLSLRRCCRPVLRIESTNVTNRTCEDKAVRFQSKRVHLWRLLQLIVAVESEHCESCEDHFNPKNDQADRVENDFGA
jgi:hypothetical protein